jgi:hypothetical protein
MILFSTPVEDDDPAAADRKAMWASAEKDAGHCSVSIDVRKELMI